MFLAMTWKASLKKQPDCRGWSCHSQVRVWGWLQVDGTSACTGLEAGMSLGEGWLDC
jgi:hypothetical protein